MTDRTVTGPCQGHEWEPVPDDAALEVDNLVTCMHCGMRCHPTTAALIDDAGAVTR